MTEDQAYLTQLSAKTVLLFNKNWYLPSGKINFPITDFHFLMRAKQLVRNSWFPDSNELVSIGNRIQLRWECKDTKRYINHPNFWKLTCSVRIIQKSRNKYPGFSDLRVYNKIPFLIEKIGRVTGWLWSIVH